MTWNKADFIAITDALVSHVIALGVVDRANTYEPKSMPGSGLTASVWLNSMVPAPGASGLSTTTARLEMSIRLYSSMLMEPMGAIDPALLEAGALVMESLTSDFTLDGLIRNIDLLGQYGEAMGGQAGYVDIDRKMMRVFTITVPCIVNDVWTQAA